MKNIQIIDGAVNATFSIFQATDDEFQLIFPNDQDIEIIEDFVTRLGDQEAGKVLAPIWGRPILKRDAQGVHGTLYYDYEERRGFLPLSKREVDMDPSAINPAQRVLFASSR